MLDADAREPPMLSSKFLALLLPGNVSLLAGGPLNRGNGGAGPAGSSSQDASGQLSPLQITSGCSLLSWRVLIFFPPGTTGPQQEVSTTRQTGDHCAVMEIPKRKQHHQRIEGGPQALLTHQEPGHELNLHLSRPTSGSKKQDS